MTEWQTALGGMLRREGYGPEAGQTGDTVQWGFAVTDDLTVSCASADGSSYTCVFTAEELSDYGEQWQARVWARLEQARADQAQREWAQRDDED